MAETHGLAASAKKVLIVEDSKTQALHLQTLLEREGLHVVWAADGREGVVQALRIRPDLILLDIELPEMNGFEVCEQLKQAPATATTPIIMFTRHDDVESVMSGLQTGVIDYIPKDVFAEAVLLETLRQMGLIGRRSG